MLQFLAELIGPYLYPHLYQAPKLVILDVWQFGAAL